MRSCNGNDRSYFFTCAWLKPTWLWSFFITQTLGSCFILGTNSESCLTADHATILFSVCVAGRHIVDNRFTSRWEKKTDQLEHSPSCWLDHGCCVLLHRFTEQMIPFSPWFRIIHSYPPPYLPTCPTLLESIVDSKIGLVILSSLCFREEGGGIAKGLCAFCYPKPYITSQDASSKDHWNWNIHIVVYLLIVF